MKSLACGVTKREREREQAMREEVFPSNTQIETTTSTILYSHMDSTLQVCTIVQVVLRAIQHFSATSVLFQQVVPLNQATQAQCRVILITVQLLVF
jgi:uncharacterized membrane protein YwzB